MSIKSLNTVLRLNATSCLGFGITFVLLPVQVAQHLGAVTPLVLQIIGALLIFNGAHLILASLRRKPLCAEVLYFVLGDFLWVAATLVLLALQIGITTSAGAVSATAIALLVGFFGYAQFRAARQVCAKN
jgi:hypothetical protein